MGVGGICPPKFEKKYFLGKYHVKFGHFVNFSGKYYVKSGHFVNFWTNIMWNSSILLNFHTFSVENVLPPKVDLAATPMEEVTELTVTSASLTIRRIQWGIAVLNWVLTDSDCFSGSFSFAVVLVLAAAAAAALSFIFDVAPPAGRVLDAPEHTILSSSVASVPENTSTSR